MVGGIALISRSSSIRMFEQALKRKQTATAQMYLYLRRRMFRYRKELALRVEQEPEALHHRSARTDDRMVQHQNHYSADERYQDAPKIEARDTMTAQSAENNSTHDTPDDPQQDIPEHSFPRLVDYFAREKTANQTDENPCNYAHSLLDWLIAGLSERGASDQSCRNRSY
jgi:hypothetical protein